MPPELNGLSLSFRVRQICVTTPILLAHGQDALAALGVAIALANVVAVSSVVLASRKRRGAISHTGFALGAVALLLGIGLSALFDWEFDVSGESIGVLLLYPISGVGIWGSLRR
jgi:hypothetical protein